MSKKLIIIVAAGGLVSFSGAFVLGWLTKPRLASIPDVSEQQTLTDSDTVTELSLPELDITNVVGTVSDSEKKAMTEKQLKNLVFEVREKVQEYNDKLQYIKVQEQRLQVAQDTLEKDIENLNSMRIELASIVANLKSERDKLLKSRLEITQKEKDNLVLIAATYDKMDASSASKIFVSMCTSQSRSDEVDTKSEGFNEAVKILYYMTDRNKAALLGELTSSEPKLAAFLTRRLKQIVEGS